MERITNELERKNYAESKRELLTEALKLNIIASGGVSTLEDITALKAQGLYGAIIGKAYYTGAIDLKKAIEAAT